MYSIIGTSILETVGNVIKMKTDKLEIFENISFVYLCNLSVVFIGHNYYHCTNINIIIMLLCVLNFIIYAF